MRRLWLAYFVFFQAEDGIRDTSVTGVQTCALPIKPTAWAGPACGPRPLVILSLKADHGCDLGRRVVDGVVHAVFLECWSSGRSSACVPGSGRPSATALRTRRARRSVPGGMSSLR